MLQHSVIFGQFASRQTVFKVLLLITLSAGILLGVFASSMNLLKLKVRLKKVVKQSQAFQSSHTLERKQITKDGS